MAALARRDSHVPFRNSKLTQLLADSLSGQAKVMMFMHVSPESTFASETTSTVQFGTKVSSITLGQVRVFIMGFFCRRLGLRSDCLQLERLVPCALLLVGQTSS